MRGDEWWESRPGNVRGDDFSSSLILQCFQCDMPKERLDKLIVERGLAESRTRAQALILAGQVLIAEQRAEKPGQMVDTTLEIRIKGETPRYVSRGGLKLEAALNEFHIQVENKTCIDVGA